jgi:uncharacterized protein YjbI with pentapeptide repeats
MAEDSPEPPQSAQELLSRYAAGEREFGAAMVIGADLRGASLRGASLIGANLSRADIRGVRLIGANLRGADLSYANLSQAYLPTTYLPGANLSHTDFGGANLSRANLQGADLFNADLHGADLHGAKLIGARLFGADLRDADLSGADLRSADLNGTILRSADLSGANFDDADLAETVLVDIDLAPICEANSPVVHRRASTIDFRSIVKSLRSPNLKDFLQRAGMPEVFVEYMIESARAVQGDAFTLFCSTFIAYGGSDEPFARKLYEALHRNGVTTFFYPVHAKPGHKNHAVMREGVGGHDRVILICSQNSLTRPGVLTELDHTLEREARDGGAAYLIPVRLDPYLDTWQTPEKPYVAEAVRGRVYANFEGAKEEAKFRAGLQRLIEALRKKK